MTRVRLLFGALLAATLALVGCAKNSFAPAKISGSVTYKGQPIKGGTMAFHTSDGVTYAAKLSSDGTYSATDIPEGELVVTIETESINPARKAAAMGKDGDKRMKMGMGQPPPAGRGGGPEADQTQFYVKIPEKFSKPNSSPLSVVVKSGRNVKDLEITD